MSKRPAKEVPSRLSWFLLGAGSVVGLAWIAMRLWAEAWGVSRTEPALPTPAPTPERPTT